MHKLSSEPVFPSKEKICKKNKLKKKEGKDRRNQ